MLKTMQVELGGFLNQTDDYEYGDYVYTEEPVPKEVGGVLTPVVYSSVVAVGLLGNALLLAVLLNKSRHWRISDIFVFNLGVADILLLLTLPFWAIQAAHNSVWSFGIEICKICTAVFNINFYCGIFLLLCITLDRYRSILCSLPLFSKNKPALAHASCVVVWVISMLLALPDWMFMVTENDGQIKTLCVHSYEKLYLRLVHLAVGFLLPAAALIFCLSHILLRLKSNSKDLRKEKALLVILPLVVVFFLCWMPYNISLAIDTYRIHFKEPQSKGSLKKALKVTSVLACVHACVRPLLYICLCANFRELVLSKQIFSKTRPEKSLWELNVGEKTVSEQSNIKEEQKQMTTPDQIQTAC
ncbi:hypothetical protein Q5P01_011471 [Channa striata]|uniref:G-protein coupled receptors family 1 profile domain-containing protein n=1 Tax=Channa striata TaxID=64152 RepID=A0AA88SQR5_CHASR|nr:hypothetical protein Q5P01_011471 [Channa striata]